MAFEIGYSYITWAGMSLLGLPTSCPLKHVRFFVQLGNVSYAPLIWMGLPPFLSRYRTFCALEVILVGIGWESMLRVSLLTVITVHLFGQWYQRNALVGWSNRDRDLYQWIRVVYLMVSDAVSRKLLLYRDCTVKFGDLPHEVISVVQLYVNISFFIGPCIDRFCSTPI